MIDIQTHEEVIFIFRYVCIGLGYAAAFLLPLYLFLT